MAGSLEEDFGHHAFVFVVEEVAVEQGHAFDYGIGEVHDYVDRSAGGNVDRVHPNGVIETHAVLGVDEEVGLVDVHGVEFAGIIENAPVLVGADVHGGHGRGIGRIFLTVDVEAVFVFSEDDDEIGFVFFEGLQIDLLKFGFARIATCFVRGV